ncbi:MAG: hypothetical protein A2519_01405 [Candidatus Raymondbacteria bacterium RIFOXYD12_FULL_49_13]|uniref:STAS domain-containing protein n=1 Tax=Candidatus Raymondbacteria bacterium RIFOXYD12_FULL_49_13 TaxID=1817890 RepID=A0A1F7F3B5_UNCRA|nr:MAG: hypothetical protein A2519_01405 [Candidatus Raymondbacteria bacterium RIFOXYD12_FULL_49_13]
MEVNVRQKGKYRILDIDGDINEIDNYNVLKEIIQNLIRKGSIFLALNLSNTTFLNSGAVGLFIAMQKKLKALSGELVIVEPPQVILEILKILNIEEAIKIYLSETELFARIEG